MKVVKIFRDACPNRNDITMFIKPKALYKILFTDDIVEGFVRCKRNGVKVYLRFDKDDAESPDKPVPARLVVSYHKDGGPSLAEAHPLMMSIHHEQAREYNMRVIKVVLEGLNNKIQWDKLWKSKEK